MRRVITSDRIVAAVAVALLAALVAGCTFDRRRPGPGAGASAENDAGAEIGHIGDAADTAGGDGGAGEVAAGDGGGADLEAGDGKAQPDTGVGPSFRGLCDPCNGTLDCVQAGLPGGHCVSYAEKGSFCATTCTGGQDCPVGYVCIPAQNSAGGTGSYCIRAEVSGPFASCPCSQRAIDHKRWTACSVRARDGAGRVIAECTGARRCEIGGLSACDAPAPTAELCNGLDDDCNGKTDDGAGAGCGDDDPCTLDSCAGDKGCRHEALSPGSGCSDGDPCTLADACGPAGCKGEVRACGDGMPCTADSCAPGSGQCVHPLTATGPCDDGNPCTESDFCLGGQCRAGTPKDCVDADPCTFDGCDAGGQCFHKPDQVCTGLCKKDSDCGAAGGPCLRPFCELATGRCALVKQSGKTCEDGDKCTVGDACKQGVCTPGRQIPGGCDDGNACTVSVCDPATGACAAKIAPKGSPCSIGALCQAGSCDGGKCLDGGAGAAPCDDDKPCTSDGCDAATGACTHKTLPAGSGCDDGDPCTESDACALGGAGMACAGKTLPCDDLDPCTVDGCATLGGTPGCAHVAAGDGGACDDGDPCTAGDACAKGSCAGAARSCDDDNPCTEDTCSPATGTCGHAATSGACDDGNQCSQGERCKAGQCTGGEAVPCDDGDACTIDSCDSGKGCYYPAIPGCGAQCKASEDCAQPPAPCLVSVCVHFECTAIPREEGAGCDDGDACTGDGEVCKGGQCLAGAAVVCDDGNACTADGCDKTKGCTTAPYAEGKPCDDGSACTKADVCTSTVAGGVQCVGTAIDCADDNPCTADTCGPASGCAHADTSTSCDDGDPCTSGDRCGGGHCRPGTPKPCADDNPCTTDGCDGHTGGCVHPANQDACHDGDPCSVGDTCQGGACKGAPRDCDDGNACTADTCSAHEGGCVHAPSTAACDDGDPCTSGDACAGGHCSGAPLSCDDGRSCTADTCDKAKGCRHTAVHKACDDGDPCTAGDACRPDGGCSGQVLNCDDGNPCTTDSCVQAGGGSPGGCKAVPNSASCDDGDVCTTSDRCAGGACKGGTPKPCDDGNPCTDDVCDSAEGCLTAPNKAACDDGSACTTGDRCAKGGCVGSAIDCDDGRVCTTDGCTASSGCSHANNRASCDDADLCTTVDRCAGGTCVGSGARHCDDGNACTDDRCERAKGCVATPNQAPCDDGNACSVGDTCGGGACRPGKTRSCDDGRVCTDDSCAPATGCVARNNSAPCDDGSKCTTKDRCAGGSCGGTPVHCDDGNACTDDGCDAAKGCTATPNGAACEDGSKCTLGDRCKGGGCIGGRMVHCDDANPCTDDACDPGLGCVAKANAATCDDGSKCTTADRCSAGKCRGKPVDCDDGKLCTVDTCAADNGCLHPANTAPCDDGSACTSGDRCSGGTCGGKPVSCDDGKVCTDDGCAPATGCRHLANSRPCDDGSRCTSADRCAARSCVGKPMDCDDGNPCTDDGCSKSSGCTHTANTAACDDGDKCTAADRCSAGSCKGSGTVACDDGDACTQGEVCTRNGQGCEGQPVPCDDGNACTDDGCDSKTGCRHVANSRACDDGSMCTSKDRCAGGKCAGAAIVCDDGKPCTDDGCDPAKGCTTADNTAACDDSNVCTTGDRCKGGECAGGPVSCDDGEVCTDDACEPAKGCRHSSNQSVCDDGNACTTGDRCAGGTCGGSVRSCDDGNPCTDDTCRPDKGCVFADNTASCDDGDLCTVGDRCSGGKCGGSARDCDDGNPCTLDTCKASKGGCVSTTDPAVCDDGNECTDDSCAPGGGCAHQNNTELCDVGNVCTGSGSCSMGTCQSHRGRFVSTLAGSGTASFADGTGAKAHFHEPRGAAMGPDGALYIADFRNNRIRRLTIAGEVTTYAGSGAPGCFDGQGSNATFNRPRDVAADGTTVYVAGFYCHAIRAIDSKREVRLLAGMPGQSGFRDGPAASARFRYPSGVAATPGGAVYVADYSNNRIRLVHEGVVSTLAGNGQAGHTDGPAGQARFSRPVGVAVDREGIVYVADTSNHRIRRIDHAGSVTTIAGTGVPGYADGAAAEARLYNPTDLEPDSAGNLWIADLSNHRIRRLAGGRITTWAGIGYGYRDGAASQALFRSPEGLAVSAQGVLYIADTSNHRIREIRDTQSACSIGGLCWSEGTTDPAQPCRRCDSAQSSTEWTVGMDGRACSDGDLCTTADRCKGGQCGGTGAACDDGDACTKDSCDGALGQCRFEVIVGCNGYCKADGDCDDGKVCTTDACVAHKCASVPNSEACDDANECTAGDVCSEGKCVGGGVVVVETRAGAGSSGYLDGAAATARFSRPLDLVQADDGSVYVADEDNHRIRRIHPQGLATTFAGSGTPGMIDAKGSQARFRQPSGVALRPSPWTLYVADFQNHRVRRIDAGANVQSIAYVPGGRVRGVAVTRAGVVYATDWDHGRILSVTPDGSLAVVAGSEGGYRDGPAASALLKGPADLDLDSRGNLYIADCYNHVIRELTTAGVVLTLAGQPSQYGGFADGPAASAKFRYPHGIAVDGAGRIYVADISNNRIRRIDPATHWVSTAAGTGGYGYRDGDGGQALLRAPYGLGITATGEILIADTNNHRVRSARPTANACRIGGVCWADGLSAPTSPCEVCRGAEKPTGWSARSAGEGCDDGQYCSVHDTCSGAGKCQGSARACNDGNPCTKDYCDGATGWCRFEVIRGCT